MATALVELVVFGPTLVVGQRFRHVISEADKYFSSVFASSDGASEALDCDASLKIVDETRLLPSAGQDAAPTTRVGKALG